MKVEWHIDIYIYGTYGIHGIFGPSNPIHVAGNQPFVCVVAHHVMLCVMQWLLLLVVGTLFLCTGYYMEFSCEIFLFFFHFTYSRVGKIKLKFILIN